MLIVVVDKDQKELSETARTFAISDDGEFYIPLSDFLSFGSCLIIDTIEINDETFDKKDCFEFNGAMFKKINQIPKIFDALDDDEAEEVCRRMEMTRDKARELISAGVL